MERVIIAISDLKKENWMILYKFIKSILYGFNIEYKSDSFMLLKEIADVRIKDAIEEDINNYEFDESLNDLNKLNKDTTCFSIIYRNKDHEDITELVPIVFLQHEFDGKIALGIDVEELDLDKQTNYKFKCSDLFILYEDKKPFKGFKSIYFINEKTITGDGEIVYFSTSRITSLAGKGNDSNYQGTQSRRYLPLIHINEDNFKLLFGMNDGDVVTELNNDELDFIRGSINKIHEDLKKKKRINNEAESPLFGIFNESGSYFDKWLESGYFNSYDSREFKSMTDNEVQGLRHTLQIYKNSIFELVQNIIFHGGASGLLYCVYNKKANMSPETLKLLPDFNKYKDTDRFLQIGIFDFNKAGIADTFKTHNEFENDDTLTIRDFFDENAIAYTGLTRLDMRHAARLGVKSFVKTIINHRGYFRVGSNDKDDGKVYITTKWKHDTVNLIEEKKVDYIDGTHYEIILPVHSIEKQTYRMLPIQQVSLLSDENKYGFNEIENNIPVFDIHATLIAGIRVSDSKENQIYSIKKICNLIIEKQTVQHANDIALDFKGEYVDPKIIFKIAAHLQLKSEDNGFEKIILFNCNEDFACDFCNLIKSLLIEHNSTDLDKGCPIWSKDCAIVIMTEDLNVQLIWGKTKSDIKSINHEIQKFYGNNFFTNITDREKANSFNQLQDAPIAPLENAAKKFILRYDMLIMTEQNITPFELFVERVLKRKISLDGLGFLVNHENTYIGNKIIVKNYFEADMMFQNSFFTERFARIVAQRITQSMNGVDNIKDKKIVLIGYKNYSEYLLKTIQRYLVNKTNTMFVVIANEETESFEIDSLFNFDIGGDGKSIQEHILSTNLDKLYFVTIVPIGATLSTNDKIIAFFKLWYKKHQEKKENEKNKEKQGVTTEIILKEHTFHFIHNHCVILVRDNISDEIEPLEKEQKWSKIEPSERKIITNYNNAKEINYTIQIASADDSKSNWVRRMNREVSFPDDWTEEKYVNFTENSSINSQNLMGVPYVDLDCVNHEVEEERLFSLWNYVYKGHFDVFNFHHKYYIDTESIARDRALVLKKWLKKYSNLFHKEILNVLITPNAESESDFVCVVNDAIFDGNALIVYLDIKNWRNNIVQKLSFLNNLQEEENVRFHFVDQAMLTGETYFKTKSYLFSVFQCQSDIKFDSIICLINRLPYAKKREILKDVAINTQNGKNCYVFIAYVNLHYPTSIDGEHDCELCRLEKYYERLDKLTVLEGCHDVIKKNIGKIKIRNKDGKKWNENNSRQTKIRNFLRLVITHELYYAITINENNTSNNSIIDVLECVYNQLIEKHVQTIGSSSNISNKIDKWFGRKTGLDEYDKWKKNKLLIDKKISFLKVISSPPLSRYIILRRYAQKKLLNELFEIINKHEEYSFDDLRIVKSIIKSLSFLKSNALVRKNVIIGVWHVLWKVICSMDQEKNVIQAIQKEFRERTDKLDREIEQLTNKTTTGIIDFERNEKIWERNRLANRATKQYLNMELKAVSTPKAKIIQDFSRDVQFYIKNAIVDDDTKATFLGDLLRSGEEMNIPDKDDFIISETRLSLDHTQNKYDNSLFDSISTELVPYEKRLTNERSELESILIKLESKNLGNKLSSIDSELDIEISSIKQRISKLQNEISKLTNEMSNEIAKISVSGSLEMSDAINYNITNIKKDYNRELSLLKKKLRCEISKLKNTLLKSESAKNEQYLSAIKDKISSTTDTIKTIINYKTEFVNFLVWLFYDNTTIIRKTLGNFSNELVKNPSVEAFFRKNNEMIDFQIFKDNESQIEEEFKKKIEGDGNELKGEYYYSSFKPYLNNKDGINFVKKLIYVTYAKFKLEDIINKRIKKGIEPDTKVLLHVLAEIMGADAAFLTVNNDDKLFPITLVGTNGDMWDYDRWNLDDGYYTKEVFGFRRFKDHSSPILLNYGIGHNFKNPSVFGEARDIKMHSLAVYVIYGSSEGYEKKSVVATITFLYNEYNQLVTDIERFRINVQEAGRLLLLLRNELDNYVIEFLIKDKVIDLWVEKHRSSRKFEKIYASSAHIFNSVYEEMEEFENLDNETINIMSRTWFFLANETISFIYSNIEKNYYRNPDSSSDLLQLVEGLVITRSNKMGDIFNIKYINILLALLKSRWDTGKEIKNKIFINGTTLEDVVLDKDLQEAEMPFNKHLLRTIIAQCLHNSLSPISKHGHRHHREIKEVYITIFKQQSPRSTCIEIKDKSLVYSDDAEVYKLVNDYRVATEEQFKRKKEFIQNMKCEDYSSTTLTSLQGISKYMKKHLINLDCDFGFDEEHNFVLTITYFNNVNLTENEIGFNY